MNKNGIKNLVGMIPVRKFMPKMFPAYESLKPWWNKLNDVNAVAVVGIALFASTVQLVQDHLVCLPAVDCDFGPNQTSISCDNGSLLALSPSTTNSFCSKYNSTTIGSRMSVAILTKLQDRRQYDFVEFLCRQTAVHWFASYFPVIIFIQGVVLVEINNLFLTIALTLSSTYASTLEQFARLVREFDNSAVKFLDMSHLWWWRRPDRDLKLDSWLVTSQVGWYDRLLNDEEVKKLQGLYEELRVFCVDVRTKPGSLNHLITLYLIQTVLQFALSVAIFMFNVNKFVTNVLSSTVKCKIDEVISESYEYFKCSHIIIPYFRAFLLFSLLFILSYLMLSICALWWTVVTYAKIPKRTDFEKTDILYAEQTFGLNPACSFEEWDLSEESVYGSKDRTFLLELLVVSNGSCWCKIVIFLSQWRWQIKEMLQNVSTLKKWSIEKLEATAENGGRTLKLSELPGIPKSVFEMSKLDSLILERITHVDVNPAQWHTLKLCSLSLIKCELHNIPPNVLRSATLTMLDVSDNRIREVPLEITKLINLHTLIIADNNLKPGGGLEHLTMLPNLKVLNLKGNELLDSLPESIGELSLRQLHVDERIVKDMSDVTKKQLKDILVYPVCVDIVIKYSPESAPRIDEMRKNGDLVYKMTSQPKGLALIFNNVHFEQGYRSNRCGSEDDAEKLERLFIGMGYDVRLVHVHQDFGREEFLNQLREVGSYPNYDSIVVVILSCGSEGTIWFWDGLNVGIHKIVEIVSNIESYRGKPKLFFIQTYPDAKLYPPRFGEEEEEKLAQCDRGDILLYRYTSPDWVPERQVIAGSPFVYSLVKVFSNYAWEKDVLFLLSRVNLVLYEEFRIIFGLSGELHNTLTKKLFFLPQFFEGNAQREETLDLKSVSIKDLH